VYSVKLELQDSNYDTYSVVVDSATYEDEQIKPFAVAYQNFTVDQVIAAYKRGDYEVVDLEG